jgi:hypothetical protein
VFGSESVNLHINGLYAEAIEAVILLAAFSAPSKMLIWILGEMKSEVRLQKCFQCVWVSVGAKISLALT